MSLDEELQRAVEFHGHLCAGLMIGWRMTKIALRELGSQEKSQDEELVAVVESDNCAVDALQVLSGCTAGKGNLIFRDEGKQAFTIGSRRSGRAVRVVMRATARQNMARYRQMSPAEFLAVPEEELFTWQEVTANFPPPARVFPSVVCASCGEAVMEPRARVKDGRIVCRSCAGEYTSRWRDQGEGGA